jgi:hypothetical protein
MKVAITGHTKGIGRSIYDYFKQSHIILGFSRSNGYDIRCDESRNKILDYIKDFDIFVNNAYSNFDDNQLKLLQEVFGLWKGTNKIIINISSRYVNDTNQYCITKNKQDQFCNANIYNLPKIINIKPGLIDTDRVKNQPGNKLSTDDVVTVLEFCIHNNVRSITFGL